MPVMFFPGHRAGNTLQSILTLFTFLGEKLLFRKYHALGNDYIVIDPGLTDFRPEPELIKKLCDRHTGIGSDGILYGPLFEGSVIGVRIFNPDGSEAEKSGNGIRIFARYCAEMHYREKKPFYLRTRGGDVHVRFMNGKEQLVCVDMGKATFQSRDIPVAGKARELVDEPLHIDDVLYRVTCLSIGNPHCVVPLEKISEHLAREIGPKIEQHRIFPKKVNVQFMKVVDRENISIEIWERGAGYTLASGSSSCAAARAAHRLGLVQKNVDVHMPGGIIRIRIDGKDHIHMTGPVSPVMKGEVSEEFFRERIRKT
jgi:diaminopimelate epimerase